MDFKVVEATWTLKSYRFIHICTSDIVAVASVHSSGGVKGLFHMKNYTETERQFRSSHPLHILNKVLLLNLTDYASFPFFCEWNLQNPKSLPSVWISLRNFLQRTMLTDFPRICKQQDLWSKALLQIIQSFITQYTGQSGFYDYLKAEFGPKGWKYAAETI